MAKCVRVRVGILLISALLPWCAPQSTSGQDGIAVSFPKALPQKEELSNVEHPVHHGVEGTAPKHSAPKKTYPDMKLTGFFQLDSAYFGQSNESIATLGDIQDGTGFRRARLAATGDINERTSYMAEFDIAQAQARFVDVWGQFNDTPLAKYASAGFANRLE